LLGDTGGRGSRAQGSGEGGSADPEATPEDRETGCGVRFASPQLVHHSHRGNDGADKTQGNSGPHHENNGR